jgi:hypothetical protein
MTAEIAREYSVEDENAVSPVQEKLTLDEPMLVQG